MTQQPPSRPLGGEIVRTGPSGEVSRPGRARPPPRRPRTRQDIVWWHTPARQTPTPPGRRQWGDVRSKQAGIRSKDIIDIKRSCPV